MFALTKVWIEKRGLKKPAALALLVGPALVITLANNADFKKMLEHSSLKATRAFQQLLAAGEFIYFKRVFKAAEEHERGSVYAVFDAGTAMAAVFREYHD